MKRMKTVAFTLLLALGAFSAITYSSCTKDECKDVTCVNGTCIGGSCSCPTGYEGTQCQTESRAKFLHQYTVTASCQTATYVANIKASNSSDITQVVISNLANMNNAAGNTTTVTATINGNQITIPTQTVVGFTAATITASGSGTISNGVITMDYTIVSGSTTNNCTNTNWQ
ncbi:MAG: calcium-binding EGF-like domain-containing protein [Bacteroidetes bacterium]|nr:calcium-binding EGF-like domain-containing protein [Bacteroidota bacterium]